MVKVVNIFKAAGLWVGTIFLLYGRTNVETAYTRDWGYRSAAVSRSPEQGGKTYGREKSLDYMGQRGGLEMQRDIGSLQQRSEPHGGGTAVGKRHKSFPQ